MSILRKFILILGAVIIVIALFISTLTGFSISQQIQQEIEREQQTRVDELMTILNISDALMSERVKSSMALLLERIAQTGKARLGEQIVVSGTPARQLSFGAYQVGNDYSMVDELTRIMGGTATIFSLTGSDFIRISTNVQREGQRATGTKLASGGLAYQQIMQRQAFYGQVDILGSPYLTGYEPIFDDNQQVIGIAYVGYSADLNVLDVTLSKIKLLERGFVTLRDSKGNIRLHSKHVSPAQIEQALANPDGDWIVTSYPFKKWGYELIVAYSKDEERQIVLGKITSLLLKVMLGGAFILLCVYFLVSRIVGQPLQNFIQVIHNIASQDGNLTVRFSESGNDEFTAMARGFNQLLVKLQQTIQSIGHATKGLVASTRELTLIAEQSTSLADKVTRQTRTVTDSVKNLQNNSHEVAGNIGKANDAAQHADSETNRSVQALDTTIAQIRAQADQINHSVDVMQSLAQSSNEISGVLEVITNIAEQTNLLALNAAIEAARAGEQGRGFAVVADEVRSLASRTQRSTTEIRAMIERLQQGSKEATSIMLSNKDNAGETVNSTQQAGQILRVALSSVSKIYELNEQSLALAKQQIQTTSHISQDLASIHELGSNNAAYASQVNEHCRNLKAVVANIEQNLVQYKV